MSNPSVNTQGRVIDVSSPSQLDESLLDSATGRLRRVTKPLAVRFWAKVKKTPTCWLWTGSKGNKHGHGSIWAGQRRNGQYIPSYAHRVSWELANGPIPPGKHVLHNCPGGDNPRCVNPDHLFLGDQAANMKDAASKGRLHMPRPRNRKVNDAQIAEMFALRQQGLTLEAIGAEFDVSKCFVSMVLRGLRRVYTAPQFEKAS